MTISGEIIKQKILASRSISMDQKREYLRYAAWLEECQSIDICHKRKKTDRDGADECKHEKIEIAGSNNIPYCVDCKKNVNSIILELRAKLEAAEQDRDKAQAKVAMMRESELRPATKYLTVSPHEQFEHVKSELNEIAAELEIGNTINLAMEIVDLQMSAETLLAVLPLDEGERNEVRRKVIAKNAVRGYYERSDISCT